MLMLVVINFYDQKSQTFEPTQLCIPIFSKLYDIIISSFCKNFKPLYLKTNGKFDSKNHFCSRSDFLQNLYLHFTINLRVFKENSIFFKNASKRSPVSINETV